MTATTRRALATAVAAAGALVLLVATAPTPGDVVTAVTTSHGTDPTAPVVAAAATLVHLLAGWLALTALLTAAGRLPGAVGAGGRAAARRVSPYAVRRALELALGLSVAAVPLAAAPALALPGTTATVGLSPSAPLPSYDWGLPPAGAAPTAVPSAAAPPSVVPSAAAPPAPAVAQPAAAPPSAAGSPSAAAPPAAGSTAGSPAAPPRTAAPRTAEPATAAPVRPAVVVRPGDSLWRLAERELAAAGRPDPTATAVAARWPAWWHANREAVGDDPDLLVPGTRLVPPSA